MEELRLGNVVFCGENPGMVLLNPDTKTTTAAASYWFCTYSPHGEGHVLLIQLDAANTAALNHPAVAIYSDNLALGRYLADRFTQYFDNWKDKNLPQASVQHARFVKESDSRSFYRVSCHAEQTYIELMWADVRDISLLTIPNVGDMGSDHYHIVTVFFLCGQATITINKNQAVGEPSLKTRDDGRISSSAFVALAETWVTFTPEPKASD